jgi:uncharacterized protein (DUF433 family)
MELPDFLHLTPHGGIRLTGSRIGLEHIIQAYNDGEIAEMIACRFPSLGLSHIYKVLAFYLDNKAAVDEYVTGVEAEFERLSAAGQHLDVNALRARLEAMNRAANRPAGV